MVGIILMSSLIVGNLSEVYGHGPSFPSLDNIDRMVPTAQDTIPLEDRYGDFIYDQSDNPFDILPSDLEQTVEYDPETDSYIVYERLGDEYFRTPTTMTFDEYLDWRAKEQEKKYFNKLGGLGDTYKSGSGRLDPMSKVDIEKNLVDRLFGGNGITIEPQGSIDLGLGARYNSNENPYVQEDQRTQLFIPDFSMDIQMNVDGKIGDKMDLGFNYDTNASFDFDRKIKLAYDSEKWTEDDIIKKIEAGNVSLPLRSSLIDGAQELFGIKTELQFGKLRLTAIASQQRSERESIQVQNGATVQEFELRPEDYDENRHFFLSHYNREVYEDALANLPYIDNSFRITNLEVWVSDDRANFQTDQTMICALADLGESEVLTSPNNAHIQIENNMMHVDKTTDINGKRLPENGNNSIFQKVIDEPNAARIKTISSSLENKFGLQQMTDFEVFRGRKLNQSEYYFNPELGFISLNVKLRPNQVLSVSYEYFYTNGGDSDELFKVGSTTDEGSVPNTDRSGQVRSEGVLFTKLLKSSNQRVDFPTWDLMMKNIYPLRTNQLDPDGFEFDIFYEDDRGDASLKKFLPIRRGRFPFLTLLDLFGLDRLNRNNDPQQDGLFDYVPGVTVIPQNGSLVFPVLEPFGSAIQDRITQELREAGAPQEEIDREVAFYGFPELYDTSVTIASFDLVQNKFVMRGRVKSTSTSEYSLGAWNIPEGSVRVTAGSQTLVEGIDYEVEYGLGRVRIINQSIIQQGVPVNISFEDNSVFSLQQKNMMGLRAEYQVSDNFYIGGTALRLQERPFTQKVNLGDDPIKNKIYGLDIEYSKPSNFLTKLIDKLPFYSTNQPSNINFSAEVAALRPGHNRQINGSADESGGIVSIDDFEGAVSGFPLSSQPNRWTLASIPQTNNISDNRWPEARIKGDGVDNSTLSGVNRARLSWYVIDRFVNISEQTKNSNPFTRNIQQAELFQRQIAQGQLADLLTFDMTYYPSERGPYNFDVPGTGTDFSAGVDLDPNDNNKLILNEPETRWAGIQRYLNNNDFEANNYQFIEFWMLNPYHEMPQPHPGHDDNEEGYITIHLGNVSEDILLDDQQFYENSLPRDGESVESCETAWGKVPLNSPINDAFPGQNFSDQDLGLDGLNNSEELNKHESYIDALIAGLSLPSSVAADPAADDFVFFNDEERFTEQDDNLLERYKYVNNPQGNSPDVSAQGNFQRGNPVPDKEDLNNNRSLDKGESYYEYRIKIKELGGFLDESATPFIRDTRDITRPEGQENERWYRFRIPLNQGDAINGIQGFRSIQFIRMLVNGFSTTKTFRMAEFELIRNQWRKQEIICRDSIATQPEFNIDVVGFEENQDKEPFGYVIPRGIVQERVVAQFSPTLQDENAMVIRFDNLERGCDLQIAKLQELDLRVYERMQLFVHAEKCDVDTDLRDKEVSVFIRVGKDFENNYYEYEIPMTFSDNLTVPDASARIWPEANQFDFPLDLFIQAKKLRNVTPGARIDSAFVINNATLLGTENTPGLNSTAAEFTSIMDNITLPEGHAIKIKGNPNLGLTKGIAIGVRINDELERIAIDGCGEVWINELRLAGLQERAGVAGLARLDMQLADLGGITSSVSYNGLGWGALDQKVNERSKEEVIEYDVATNLELGKFFPSNWGMSIPFYAQYATSITNPEFDAYDLDITRKDEINLFQNAEPEVQEDVRERSQKVNTIKTFNFTNVRKQKNAGNNARPSRPNQRGAIGNTGQQQNERKKTKKPMPWDVSNFSATYSYTESEYRDEIISSDKIVDQYLGVDYTYSRKAKGITPFNKVIKNKNLKILKELNFNPIPNSFTFNTGLNRFESTRQYRLPVSPIFEFDDKRFDWERNYDLNWSLTKALKINYSAQNISYIDEIRQTGIAATPAERDWQAYRENDDGFLVVDDFTSDVESNPNLPSEYWKENLGRGGRNTDYNHNVAVSYTLPTKLIPYMDWIDIKGQYRADYTWSAGALITDVFDNPLPGIIQNSQNRSVTANLNFDKLYKKSKYVKSLDKTKGQKTRRRLKTDGDQVTVSKDEQGRTTTRKKEREASVLEKLLVRPLFLLRSARLTYREDFQTVLPGYTGTPELVGLSDAFTNPGAGFVFGLQPNLDHSDPDNFLTKAVTNQWLTDSQGFNQELTQTSGQNIEAKFKIEPWRDFKLEIDFKKAYRNSHAEVYKNLGDNFGGFQSLAARDLGSFDMTFYNLNTLFGTNIDELFEIFEGNRPVISQRLAETTRGFAEANGQDPLAPHQRDGPQYAAGFGKQSSAVLVPAFLAAYTDQDPSQVELDLETQVRRRTYIPKPNWNLRYDGLTKLPWFKDKFSSFTLQHAYSSRLRVSSFNTDVEYDRDFFGSDGLANLRQNGNYYTRIEIPAIQISENFNPVIGLKMKTRSDFTLEFEYVKSRDLNLKINTSSQLEEDKKTGFVFGMGYTIKNSNFLKGGKKKRTRTRRDKDEDEDSGRKRNSRVNTGGKVTSDRGSDMTFMLNFAFNDNQFFVHELDSNRLQENNETRGDRGFQVSPSVDYNLNENVSLRAFFDYNTNTPYGSTNFKRTNVNGGIVMILTLN